MANDTAEASDGPRIVGVVLRANAKTVHFIRHAQGVNRNRKRHTAGFFFAARSKAYADTSRVALAVATGSITTTIRRLLDSVRFHASCISCQKSPVLCSRVEEVE